MAAITIESIVLAGGAGARFGGGKLVAPFRGKPLIAWALDAAAQTPVRRVIVVTGADAEAVREAALASGVSASIVHAADHTEGMAATLRAGVAALSAEATAAFVFLGDMPLIPGGLTGRLAAALNDGLAAAPVLNGRRGHPVLFSRALFPDLLRLQGDAGARRLLDGLGDRVVEVSVEDSGVLFDVDRRGDLER